ncbi:hypothetical protein PGT21_009006 [Puccinia graminis f. sp. tritici]|uniref:Uncharacterized protein n=1 Tax=Puccinia graminis f. sp. tritici TaxID=56615 RepID=A0A5B0QEY4_PUCGR|nr:hypothetical protein PGT21_009006 [Puccinia graminis f. sp. tritici]
MRILGGLFDFGEPLYALRIFTCSIWLVIGSGGSVMDWLLEDLHTETHRFRLRR